MKKEKRINNYSNNLNDYFDILRKDKEFVKYEKVFNILNDEDYMSFVYEKQLTNSDNIQYYLHSFLDEEDDFIIYTNINYSFNKFINIHKYIILDEICCIFEDLEDLRSKQYDKLTEEKIIAFYNND